MPGPSSLIPREGERWNECLGRAVPGLVNRECYAVERHATGGKRILCSFHHTVIAIIALIVIRVNQAVLISHFLHF